MKININLLQLIGFIFTSIGGIILHYLYDWTNLTLVAPFSGVNESTWEHMKLLFWPMFIYAIIESFFLKNRNDFWHIKLKGILLGLILIPIIFYTYNGVFGHSPDWINIAIFFFSAFITYVYETKKFKQISKKYIKQELAIILLFLISFSFIIFTFNTPKIKIFKDPLTESYGIKR